VYLLIPVVLSILTATFEGISVGLLIPLVKGTLTMDFRFMTTMKGISTVLDWLPADITSSNKLLLTLLICLFVVTVVLKNITRYGSVLTMTRFAYRSAHYLRRMIFARYLSFGKLYFDRTSVGHHTTVLSAFTDLALRPLLSVDKYMNALFSLITYLAVMCTISWKLTLFAAPLFLVLHWSVRTVIVHIRRISQKVASTASELGRKSIEILSTLPLVTSYNMQDSENRHYGRISDEMSHALFRTTRYQEIIRPIQELETMVAILLLLVAMLWLSANGEGIESSSFIVYFYLVVNASSKFGILTNFRSGMAGAVGPLEQVTKVFDEDDKEYVDGGETPFTGIKKNIELRHLSFSYTPDRKVLDNLTFDMERGKVTAIVGPTGSGKTTIINLLLRYYDCPPGTIFLDGTDIREFTIPSLRSHMALVSQETLLLHDSLRYNITYGLHGISDERINEAIKRARLEEFVKSLPEGFNTVIGDRGVKLSGGEKQRVSIARALLKGADILILDEATSSLDSKTEQLIQEAIDDVSQGKTSLVIAHRLSTIKNADKIVFLEHGKCIEQGSLDELLAKKGRFAEHWEAQRFG
jgi:subfamily B ATP-binding cassette protein MsbA